MESRKKAKLLQSNHNKRLKRINQARKASRRQTQIQHVHRQNTVDIDSQWNMMAQFDLASVTKLETGTPQGEDLKWAGSLRRWNDKMDRVNVRSKVALKPFVDRVFYYTSANEDPVLQEYAQEDEGNVFATDAVLAHLMTCARSVYPWDIVITYMPGGSIFLDVRDALEFSMHTVCETAHQKPAEGASTYELNGAASLAEEGSAVNETFTQQSLMPGTVALPKSSGGAELPTDVEEDPFWDEDEAEEGQTGPAAVAYRYRKFDVSAPPTCVCVCVCSAIAARSPVIYVNNL